MCVCVLGKERRWEVKTPILTLLLGTFCFQIVIKASLTILRLIRSVICFLKLLGYLISLNTVSVGVKSSGRVRCWLSCSYSLLVLLVSL